MKVSTIKTVLKNIKAVVPVRTKLQVLHNIKISEDGIFSATDLDTWYIFRSGISLSAPICINYKLFSETISVIESENIELTVEDNTLYISDNGAKISIVGVDHREYPTIPDYVTPVNSDSNIEIYDTSLFLDAVRTSGRCASEDESRYILTCVAIEANRENNTINTIGTNGHRLLLNKNIPAKISHKVGEYVLINPEVTAILSGISDAGDITIYNYARKFTRLDVGEDITIIQKDTSEHIYVDYRRGIPERFSRSFDLGTKKDLITEIKRAGKFSNKKTHLITFNSEDGSDVVSIGANNNEVKREYSKELRGSKDHNPSAESFRIGFNHKYLVALIQDTYSSNSDTVSISCNNGVSATIMESGDRLALIMPLRIIE